MLERAPRVDPVGAGITLFGNAMRALDRLGVAEAVAARGAAATRSAILTSEGRELTRVPSDLLEGTIALHRADLQAELGRKAAICASAWRSPRSSSARTESSPEAPTAARSEAISGRRRRPELRGPSRDRRRADPLRRLHGLAGVSSVPVEAGRLTESWGVGERFGLVDIGRGRTYWFATKNAPEGEPDEPSLRKEEIRRRFSGWHEPIAAVVEAADESAILRNDVYYLEPFPRWSDGRIVLVGDAARRRPASGRARRRPSRMPSSSPTASYAGTNTRPLSPSTRRSVDREPKPFSRCPAAPTRLPSSPTRSAGASGTHSSTG